MITGGHEAKERLLLHFNSLAVVWVQNLSPFYLYTHHFAKYLMEIHRQEKARFQSPERNQTNLRSKPGLLNFLFY